MIKAGQACFLELLHSCVEQKLRSAFIKMGKRDREERKEISKQNSENEGKLIYS